MKKVKLTRTIAAAICAAIAVLGCVFLNPQTDINQAAADTGVDEDFCIDDFSLFFSSDDELKCRLKVYIPAYLFYPLLESSYVVKLGEQLYTGSIDVVISTADSTRSGERLKKMVAPAPTVTDGVSSYVFPGPGSSSFYESNVNEFCSYNSLTLKRFNKGDGSTVFEYTETDAVCCVNFDFPLLKVQEIMKKPTMRTFYDSDFSFYCVRSELRVYRFDSDYPDEDKFYSGYFYLAGTANVLSCNIADEARKMLKDNSITYTAEQQSVLKTVAGRTNEESSSLKNTDDSFKSLKKAIMAVCGVAIIAGVCVCLYLIFKRKGLNFIPVKRKTNGGKVRQRKK